MQPAKKGLCVFILIILLAGCSGGGGGSEESPIGSRSVAGGGVKGPLANADITVYAFNASQPGFKGATITTATTNASAAITGLNLPVPLAPPYIMEFTSTGGTTDLTTRQFPVITTLRTVITQTLLDTGEPLYATPLTTMAVDIAVSSAADTNGTSGIQSDEFETALANAATQVVSTLGFGMGSSVDIFDTPPLVDDTTSDTGSQARAAAYRAAVEAVTAIAYQINEQSSGSNTDSVLTELAADLADGGGIDGSQGGTINSNTLALLQQDPDTLTIPNTTRTVADVKQILVDESSTTAPSVSVTELGSGGSIHVTTASAQPNPDLDGDGVPNVLDAFPLNASESVDSDGDGIGDNADPDDNNNGILDVDEDITTIPGTNDSDADGIDDATDNCPTTFNPVQTNTDSDSEGDACDTDDDNDGVADSIDAFPLNPLESIDTDSDGLGNNADSDDDNDGIPDNTDTGTSPIDNTTPCALLRDCDGDGVFDSSDAFPANANEQWDTDGDGTGNHADTDDDNDGVSDSAELANGTKPLVADTDNDGVIDGEDALPLDPTESVDTDGDGTGNNADTDDDNDGVADEIDAFPLDSTESIDTDNDGIGNNADTDDDNDGLSDTEESVLGTDPLLVDSDSDTVGDAEDNCPLIANTNQTNTDGAADGGDACDSDDDNDGYADEADAFPQDPNEWVDTDSDDIGNNADPDDDNDGHLDEVDAFPLDSTEWLDTDSDGIGNNADTDDDNDGLSDTQESVLGTNPLVVDTDSDTIGDASDNCPLAPNTDQVNTDGAADGGDACDADDDNDGVPDGADAFPLDPNESVDTDHDGIGNNADTDDDGDGVEDTLDAFPLDPNESVDTDGDGIGNNADTDDDGDGVPDTTDAFPLDANETIDTDGDGVGNNADTDDDDDGVPDVSDAFPLDPGESIDTDGDGIGNNTDTDDDNDGVPDTTDNCPLITNADQADSNGNGIGDACDNVAPVIEQTGPLAVTMDEDGLPQGFVAPTVSAIDAESDTLNWSTTGATHGIATVSGTGNSPGVLSYVPDANFNGNDSFSVNVSDGISTVGIVINVTVSAQNDAPTITGNPALVATEGVAYSFVPGGGDVDTGDTLTYSITGQPSWAAFSTTTGELSGTPQSGDANIYGPILISVSDGAGGEAALPEFTITVALPGGPVDITGVWNFTITNDTPADNPSGCSGEIAGAVENLLVAIKQNGTGFDMTSLNGDHLTGGVIDTVTGQFSISGLLEETKRDLTDTVVPRFEFVTITDSVDVSGSVTASNSLAGAIVTINQAGDCDISQSYEASRVHRHTGSENYNGVYAVEVRGTETWPGQIDTPFVGRGSTTGQLEIYDDPSLPAPWKRIDLHFFFFDLQELEQTTTTISNNRFNPETGYFELHTVEEGNFDGTNSYRYESNIHGLLVGDPATDPGTNGAPILFATSLGWNEFYSGDFRNGGVLTDASIYSDEIYGKLQSQAGFTRTDLQEQGNQTLTERIVLGLSNPPLKRVDINSQLYFQVLDGSTVLCSGPYASTNNGYLYNLLLNDGVPDFDSFQFRSGSYSSVSCNTSDANGNDQVIYGATYKMRILDTGPDGVLDTISEPAAVNDDVILFDSDTDLDGGYQAEVVIPAERFSKTPNVFDISINGAKTSTTLSGDVIQIPGYFDFSEDVTVSWPTQEANTTDYQLRLENNTGPIIEMKRFNTTGLSTVIPANSAWDTGNTLRLIAMDKTPPTTPGTQARSRSRKIGLTDGVWGLFNIELGIAVHPLYNGLQVYLNSNPPASLATTDCYVMNRVTAHTYCTGATVDRSTDTVTLAMVDGFGLLTGTPNTSYTLVLHFKPSGTSITSASAVVTSPDVAAIPATVDPSSNNWVTSARVANTEIGIRSLRWSDGSIESEVVALNSPNFGVWDQGLFQSDSTATIRTLNLTSNLQTDTGISTEYLYDDAISGREFITRSLAYVEFPTDDHFAQPVGLLLSSGTQSDFGLGFGSLLAPGTYRGKAHDIQGLYSDLVYRVYYAANDPSAYFAPTLDDVNVVLPNSALTINCSTGVACEVSSPVATGIADASSFCLTWTVPTPPTGSRWRLIGRDVSTNFHTYSSLVLPDAIDSPITSLDNGNGTTTYTWTNQGYAITAPGAVSEINIQVSSGEDDYTMTSYGSMIPAHRIHVTQ